MGFSSQLFIWREGSFWQEKLLLKLQGCAREGSGEVLLWSCWLPSPVLSAGSVALPVPSGTVTQRCLQTAETVWGAD